MSRLRLLTREGCHLCEEMRAELSPWAAAHGATLSLEDVDTDPELRRRYGHRIPVLLVDDEPIVHGQLTAAALESLAQALAGPRGAATRLL